MARKPARHPQRRDETTHIARLRALRAQLSERGLAGFLVPHADVHQGEYIPESEDRLKFLTGFDGSAGEALVLGDRTLLFVDGRYVLQASTQVPEAAVEVLQTPDSKPETWLKAHAEPGARIGYDPWLHTPRQVVRLTKALKSRNAILEPVETNPVDAIWSDRPPPPLGPATPHHVTFAGRESADKREEIASILKAAGLAACVLTQPESVAWLLNLRGADLPFIPVPLCMAIVDSMDSVDLFIAPEKLQAGLAGRLGHSLRCHPPERLGDVLDELGRKKAVVGLDFVTAPEWVRRRLLAGGAEAVAFTDPCLRPKAVKNATEIAGARAAHLRDGAALTRFLCWFETQAAAGTLSEWQAAEKLRAFRAENDLFRSLSFPTIAGYGGNGAIVHYRTSPENDAPIAPPGLFLLDSGGQYFDGTTDVTRTVFVGAAGVDPPAEWRRAFTLVLKGHIALATARFPKGTAGRQLDALARRHLWEAGLDYDHGTGHGVGAYLSVHEGPQRISKSAGEAVLERGMILSNEPGYYRPGAFGIRIENLVIVTAADIPAGGEREMHGFETLTRAPIDRRLTDAAMLAPFERDWLNGYHAQVREELSPLLDETTAQWLAAATAPI